MSSPPSHFHFTELPLELQREILLTSGLEDTTSAIRLVCVSKRAYSWCVRISVSLAWARVDPPGYIRIAPIIYNMVTLGSDDTALFLRTLASKPPEFFAAHVKCLCLSVSVQPMEAEKILSTCTGVRMLAFWVDQLSTLPDTSVTQLLSPLSLRKLSIEVQHLHVLCQSTFKTSTDGSSLWYTNLIHLDIVFWSEDNPHPLPDLTHCRSLTHVGLWNPSSLVVESLVSEVLNLCEQLEILLVVFHECDMAHRPTFHDRRVVFMPYPARVVQDWEDSFQGQSNTWSRAQEAVLANAKPKDASEPNVHNSGESKEFTSSFLCSIYCKHSLPGLFIDSW
jgi:hypothetical protein